MDNLDIVDGLGDGCLIASMTSSFGGFIIICLLIAAVTGGIMFYHPTNAGNLNYSANGVTQENHVANHTDDSYTWVKLDDGPLVKVRGNMPEGLRVTVDYNDNVLKNGYFGKARAEEKYEEVH